MFRHPYSALAGLLLLALALVAAPTRGAVAQQQCAPNTTISLSAALGSPMLCGATENGTTVYRGVPYAVPPTGTNRWVNTVPLTTSTVWSGTLQATQFAPICPQPGANNSNQSEDCLYLNVWTPNTAPNKPPTVPLPVMVFIHGGAFVTGAGSLPAYDGAALAKSGNVVVVTLNYRLGALGFLYVNLGLGSTPNIAGNFGLRDQQTALQWVNANISSFGGDPNKVTLFGESAGAMSVALHLTSIPTSNATYVKTSGTGNAPPNVNLFQRAIMESNPFGLPYRNVKDIVNLAIDGMGKNYLNSICKLLNSNNNNVQSTNCWNNSSSVLSFLQSVQLEALMQAQLSGGEADFVQNMLTYRYAGALPWAPVYDANFVMNQPSQGYYQATGSTNGVNYKVYSTPMPVLFGVNMNEGATFVGLAEASNSQTITNQAYPDYLLAIYKSSSSSISKIAPYKQDSLSNAAPNYYFAQCDDQAEPASCTFPTANCTTTGSDTTCTDPGNGGAVALADVITDDVFKCASLAATDNLTNGTGVGTAPAIYGYLFAQPPVIDIYGDLPACSPESGNVCHGNELPYVFGTLPNFVFPVQTSDGALSTAMMNAWTSFAASGSPGASAWSAFTASAQNMYQLGGTGNGTVVTNIATTSNCTSLWNGIYPISSN